MTAAFPLTWPEHVERSKTRERSKFKASLNTALSNVETSVKLFGKDSKKVVSEITISSNVTLGRTNPSDPGVALWFTWDGIGVCFPIDRYDTVAANLQAIHHVIEARRVELRHGTLALVRSSFMGFKALPPMAGSSWWEVLGVDRNESWQTIEQTYRAKAKKAHPDAGGSTDAMQRLTAAYAAAKKERT
jgi:hypothetical protein